MIKPDGVQRGLVGKIIQRFEERGYQVRCKPILAFRQDADPLCSWWP